MNSRGFFFLCLVIHSTYSSSGDFFSLQGALNKLPENVVSDNHEWEDPNYTSFYKSLLPSWTDRILHLFRVKDGTMFSTSDIEKKLQTALMARKKNIVQGSDYVAHITVQPGSHFIVVGDLFGALHSLFRDLEHLVQNGIIDDQLKIIKPDYYMVFIGNAINRSAYSLETLYTILVLLEKNPDKVFYVRGKHEANNYWKSFSLRRQVAIRLGGFFQESTIDAFEDLLSDFFASLPTALYLTQNDATHATICISNELYNYKLAYVSLDQFFSQKPGTISYVAVLDKTSQMSDPPISAIIKGSNGTKVSFAPKGLARLLPDQGAAVWSVLSSPTQIYQEFAGFFTDTFVMLTIGSTITQSTIQGSSQDIRNKNGFARTDLFNVITGQSIYEQNPELKPTDIIGSTIALTKGLPEMAQQVELTMSALINQYNKDHFATNKFVKAVILDDQYVPSMALKNVEILLNQYGINTLLLPMGSPTLETYIDMVKAGKVTVLFPVTGSTVFRKPDVKHIVYWRASYQDEARALIEHILAEHSVRKFAFFYQNDSYGLNPLETAHAILKEKGITDWVDIPYNRTDISFADAVATLHKTQPEAIGFFSIASATEEFCRQAGIEILFNRKLFGISFLADNSFRNFLQEQGINFLFSSIVPNPKTSDLPIVKECRDLLDKENKPYNVFALEGYICTSLYLHALDAIKNPATPDALIQHFESYKDFHYKGLTMTFNPNNRGLGQNVWLELDEHTWKEVKVTK